MSTRLPGAKYKSIFDRGRSLKGRLLVAWYLVDQDADHMAGVIVSKRTFHDAVDRNRAKRIIREAFRLAVKEGAMGEARKWIFIARGAIGGKRTADVMKEMKWFARHLSH